MPEHLGRQKSFVTWTQGGIHHWSTSTSGMCCRTWPSQSAKPATRFFTPRTLSCSCFKKAIVHFAGHHRNTRWQIQRPADKTCCYKIIFMFYFWKNESVPLVLFWTQSSQSARLANKIFHTEDFELQLLQKGHCPFCRSPSQYSVTDSEASR